MSGALRHRSVDSRSTTLDLLRALAVLWVIAGHALIVAVRPTGVIGELLDPIHAVGLFFAAVYALQLVSWLRRRFRPVEA